MWGVKTFLLLAGLAAAAQEALVSLVLRPPHGVPQARPHLLDRRLVLQQTISAPTITLDGHLSDTVVEVEGRARARARSMQEEER